MIDFEKGKIGSTFRSVKILRKSRLPHLFGEINVCLPSGLIRWFASRNKMEGEERKIARPYLRLRYVDDNLHMLTTDSGNWFVQTRI